MTCACSYENDKVIGLCGAHATYLREAIEGSERVSRLGDIQKLLAVHGYESVTQLLARTEQYRAALEVVITQRNRLDTALFKSNVTLWLEAVKD